MKKIKLLTVLVISVCIMTSCKLSMYREDDKLGHLAFDEYQNEENLIYIEEKDGYQPYIVLTNNYSENEGQTLLLRKYLLEDFRRMNEYYAEYEDCEMDAYLNKDFKDTLSTKMQEKLNNTEIIVTEQTWQGAPDNGKNYTIDREIFLISLSEVDFILEGVTPIEGKVLEFFKDHENRSAFIEDDDRGAHSWWLRSNHLYTESTFCFVFGGDDVGTNSTNAYDSNAVRPAFCLPTESEITTSNEIIDGESVYVLK